MWNMKRFLKSFFLHMKGDNEKMSKKYKLNIDKEDDQTEIRLECDVLEVSNYYCIDTEYKEFIKLPFPEQLEKIHVEIKKGLDRMKENYEDKKDIFNNMGSYISYMHRMLPVLSDLEFNREEDIYEKEYR